jgi:hypothetical protein
MTLNKKELDFDRHIMTVSPHRNQEELRGSRNRSVPLGTCATSGIPVDPVMTRNSGPQWDENAGTQV